MVSGGGVVAAEWTLAIASCLFYFFRLYVRRYISRVGFQREDILLGIGQALFFCWISIDAYNVHMHFMDDHRSYLHNFVDSLPLSDPEKIHVLKVVYASSIPYYLCLWSVKFAIIGLYFRIVPASSRKSRLFLWTTFFFTIMSGLVVVLINLLLCQPVSRNWSLNWDDHCYSSTAILPFAVSVVFNIITDVMIFAVPFPVLSTLKSLTQKQRIGLIATFSLGLITICVTIIRVIFLALSGQIALSAVFSAVECFTFMTVASMPAMRVLLRKNPFRRSQQRKSDSSEDDSHVYQPDGDSRYGDGTGYTPGYVPGYTPGSYDAEPISPHSVIRGGPVPEYIPQDNSMSVPMSQPLPHIPDEKQDFHDHVSPVSASYSTTVTSKEESGHNVPYTQSSSTNSQYHDYEGDEDGVHLVNLRQQRAPLQPGPNQRIQVPPSGQLPPTSRSQQFNSGYYRGGGRSPLQSTFEAPMIINTGGSLGNNLGSVYGEELPPVPTAQGRHEEDQQRDPFVPDYLQQNQSHPTI